MFFVSVVDSTQDKKLKARRNIGKNLNLNVFFRYVALTTLTYKFINFSDFTLDPLYSFIIIFFFLYLFLFYYFDGFISHYHGV